MRAREFIINLPISPNLSIDAEQANDEQSQDQQAVMVPPLQQELELKKAALGKSSPVIQNLVQDDEQDRCELDAITRLLNR